MGEILIKRIYEAPESSDGYRVLIDRVWPRGISKEQAALDEWAKDLAPSTELRKWFGHEPARFEEFRTRYLKELAGRADHLDDLRARSRSEQVTILFGARDERHSNAVVLKELLSSPKAR